MKNFTLLIAIGISITMLNGQQIDAISNSAGGISIRGENTNTSNTNSTGVYGVSYNGVRGYAFGSQGRGVYGISEGVTGIGVYGKADGGNGNGVYGRTEGKHGLAVRGYANGEYGIGLFGLGEGKSGYGIFASSSIHHGAYFKGGIRPDKADIVLGGYNVDQDDGVIMSDSKYPSSDLILRSYDDVIVELDQDSTDDGFFEIWGQADTVIFRVTELGNVFMHGDISVSGDVVHSSDINRKENITNLDNQNILYSIRQMPIYEWQYRGQNKRHIGPMAQDFFKAFGLGNDDKIISSIDVDGVALAAIKAQQDLIEKQEAKIELQESRITSLERELSEIRSLLMKFLAYQGTD